MARVVSIPCQAASTKAYTLDRDTTLVSFCAMVTGSNVSVLSTDPSLTAAAITGGPAASASVTGDILCLAAPNSLAFSQNLQIPLKKDSTIYVATSSASWSSLLFDDELFSSGLVT